MTRNGRIYALLLAGVSTVSLMLGALLAVRSAFGAVYFVAGLILHLLGIAGCLYVLSGLFSQRWQLRPIAADGSAAADSGTLREAHFRVVTQAMRMALGAVLLLFALACVWFTERHLSELAALRRSGQRYEAQVINKEREAELGSATTGLVYYSFRVNGVPVTGRFRAPRSDYPLLRTGRRLTITFLPANPNVHRLGVVDNRRVVLESAATLLLVLCGAVYVAGPVVAVERRLRQDLRLARCGVAVTAAIIGSRPIYRGRKCVGYSVRYAFTLPEGRELQGRARIGRIDGEPTLIDFPITVLYDPVRPEHHRPLAAFHMIRFMRMPKNLLAA